mmetsp:Transcript_13081/g.35903  ORF Transcript_13081/g.35903 Transcript_13081/m.35903 type:complete len:210 (+) Transcript_13081:528-1157(+)
MVGEPCGDVAAGRGRHDQLQPRPLGRKAERVGRLARLRGAHGEGEGRPHAGDWHALHRPALARAPGARRVRAAHLPAGGGAEDLGHHLQPPRPAAASGLHEGAEEGRGLQEAGMVRVSHELGHPERWAGRGAGRRADDLGGGARGCHRQDLPAGVRGEGHGLRRGLLRRSGHDSQNAGLRVHEARVLLDTQQVPGHVQAHGPLHSRLRD